MRRLGADVGQPLEHELRGDDVALERPVRTFARISCIATSPATPGRRLDGLWRGLCELVGLTAFCGCMPSSSRDPVARSDGWDVRQGDARLSVPTGFDRVAIALIDRFCDNDPVAVDLHGAVAIASPPDPLPSSERLALHLENLAQFVTDLHRKGRDGATNGDGG